MILGLLGKESPADKEATHRKPQATSSNREPALKLSQNRWIEFKIFSFQNSDANKDQWFRKLLGTFQGRIAD